METTDRTSQLYLEGDYLALNPNWHAEDSPWKAERILRLLKRNGVEPARVAEVGCGAGEILIQLAHSWPNTVFDGYDISPQAHAIARQRETENIHFELGDFTEMGRDDYDLTLVIDVVEHIEDYYGFLRRIRPRGRYTLFHVPLDISVLNLIKPGSLTWGREHLGHIQTFTKESILSTLRETGYEIVDWMYTTPNLSEPRKGLLNHMRLWARTTMVNKYPDAAALWLGRMSVMILTK